MSEELANPPSGAMTDDAAVQYLLNRDRKPEAQAEPEREQQAEPAQEPEAAEQVDDAEPEQAEESPKIKSKHRVKVQGEELEVDYEELIAGYSRERDYRQKTQTLAEERKAIAAERDRQAQITRQLQETLQGLAKQEPEPDWVKLAKEDPLGYVEKRAEWEQRERTIADVRRKAEEATRQQQAAIAAHEAAKLREAVPEWSDSKRFTADYQRITKDAGAFYGFNEAEISAVLDHRVLLVLRDAAEYRRAKESQQSADKKVATAPKVVKPGQPQPRNDAAAEREKARARLKREGSTDAAVAFLMARKMANGPAR